MPVVLRTNKGRKELFDEVAKSRYFKFKDQKDVKNIDMATVFVLAAVYGYEAGSREEIGASEWVTRHEYLASNTHLLGMCQAVAVTSSGSIDVLSDEEEVFKIVEEFANAGIIELHNRITKENEADYTLELQAKLQGISD